MAYPKFGEAALSPLVKLLTSLLVVLTLIVFIACSDDAAPGDCIDAARDAGVPDRVIEWMKDPVEEWGTIERIAIREALEKFGIGEFCSDVSAKLDIAESSAMNNALEMAKDAAKAALTPSPEPSAPAPNPTRRPPATPLPAPTAARALMPTPVAVIPTPKPALRPPSTPLPAPTTAPLPTSTPSPSDTTRITHVTFSGVAGEKSSRFTVHFSHPVIISLPDDFDIGDDKPPINLRIGKYDAHHLDDLPVSESVLRSKRPTDILSFGPVSEFTVAHYLEVTDALQDQAGSPAFSQRFVPLPGDTVFLNPGFATDIIDPTLVSCVAFMESAGIHSPVIKVVKGLSTESLTDTEREEWRRFLIDSGNISIYMGDWPDRWTKSPCVSLWSAEINERNAAKRNRDWEGDCIGSSDRFVNQAIHELVNRPYTALDANDVVVLQMRMGDSDYCRVFYPQLFYGRWVPMSRN